jgi:signal transduction histidine kinase
MLSQSPSNLKSKFIAGLILAVVLIICNQILIQRALRLKERDSALINLAGKQRMLSQRIALEFHKLAKYDTHNMAALEKDFREWQTAHKKIVADSAEINQALPDTARGLSAGKWAVFLSARIDFAERKIIEYRQSKPIELDVIDRNQDQFLEEMDRIVLYLVEYSDEKLRKVIILEIILAGLSILVIFLEVRYIYYPQAKLLKDSLAVIQAKNKDLEQFTYVASHDLKEPLRTISNYIEVIEDDCSDQLDEHAKTYLGKITRAADRMRALIDYLLDFSRLGRDRKFGFVDCNRLLAEVITDLSRLIEANQAIITIGDLPSLLANEIQLRQLFQNLISNAIKFKRKDILPEIVIKHIANKATHEFHISDNGIGIESKHFGRIFQMFQKLNKDQDFEGYGIGLANCNRIVELHGGQLWVESEPGHGSTFKFTLQKSPL